MMTDTGSLTIMSPLALLYTIISIPTQLGSAFIRTVDVAINILDSFIAIGSIIGLSNMDTRYLRFGTLIDLPNGTRIFKFPGEAISGTIMVSVSSVSVSKVSV